MHLSNKYGPIQVLSGIVILKKYFVSVGIQVFATLLNENVLIRCLNVSKILVGNPGKNLEKTLNFALRKVWVP